MYVCYRYDESFVRSEERLNVSGIYILLWPMMSYNGIRDVYIGQTSSLSRRFQEHLKTRDFECACMFTAIDRRLTKTEILYLEYTTIMAAMEYGSVHLLENYQIPTLPDISISSQKEMDEFFDTMRLVIAHAGYKHIFEKFHMFLRDSGSSTRMLQRICDSQMANPPAGRPLFTEEDTFDEEDSVLVSYEAKGKGFSAKCIPTKDSSYFIMPKSTVAPYVSIDSLDETSRKSIEASTRSFPHGLMTDSLASAAQIITGRNDASVWTITRTVI